LYTDPHGRFAIQFPKDWAWTPVSPSGEPLVVFVHPKKEAAVIVERFQMKQTITADNDFAEVESQILKENQPTIIDVAPQAVDQGGRRFVVVDYTRPGPRDRERVRHYAFPVGQNLYRLTCSTLFDRFARYESIFLTVFNSLTPAGATGSRGAGLALFPLAHVNAAFSLRDRPLAFGRTTRPRDDDGL